MKVTRSIATNVTSPTDPGSTSEIWIYRQLTGLRVANLLAFIDLPQPQS
jgi:hypothetical protein